MLTYPTSTALDLASPVGHKRFAFSHGRALCYDRRMAGIPQNYAHAGLEIEPLIAKLENGAFLRDLARDTGIDKRRLSEILRKHPDYALAKECAIETQLDEAEERLGDSASDIARAREQWRAATWRAERECPARWGQVNKLTGPDGGPIQVQVVRFGQVIEGETVSSTQHAALLPPPKG